MGPSRQVGALPQSWQNVCLPRELTEVRRNWIDDRQDGLNKSGDEPWILVALLSDIVALLNLQKRVKNDDDVLDFHLLVSLTSLLQGHVDLVQQDVIPKMVASNIIL